MAYKIRIILDVEEDVIRDIVVKSTINLEDLHAIISKTFGFTGQEMAAFYKADDQWQQGEEIPLCDMNEDPNALIMSNCLLSNLLKKGGDKLIYVYDFFLMWTFFVELLEPNSSINVDFSKTIFSFGNVPEQAPEKEFIADDSFDDIDLYDDDSNFQNIDDIDFDNY